MSAEMSITVGEFNTTGYSVISSADIEENWWIKYGRFVEFQLIFTSTRTISASNTVTDGLPIPAQNNTFACLESQSPVRVSVTSSYPQSGCLTAVNSLSASRHVLHGVYIAES